MGCSWGTWKVGGLAQHGMGEKWEMGCRDAQGTDRILLCIENRLPGSSTT